MSEDFTEKITKQYGIEAIIKNQERGQRKMEKRKNRTVRLSHFHPFKAVPTEGVKE